MSPDEHADATTGDPNPRRDGARASPIIEGEATEIGDNEQQTAAESAKAEPRPPGPAAKFAGPLAVLALALAVLALAGAAALWRGDQAGEADLAGRMRALSEEAAALKDRSAPTQALDRRLDAIAASAKAAASAAAAAQARSAQALAAMKAARSTGAAGAVAQASQAQLAALQAALQKVGAQVADLRTRAAQAEAQTTKLDQRVASLETTAAAQAKSLVPLEALLKAPKIDVRKVEASTARAESEARAAALIVAARALQQRIDAGEPFARELAATEKLGADPAALRPVQASAALGVRTAPQLRRAFENLTGPILAGLKPAQNDGVLGRLAEEAGRLVRIRTVGSSKGSAPIEVVGRIESALAAGDVATALKDRLALPESAQALTANWAAEAQATADADAAAERIRAQAVDQLGKAKT